jgi:patatin-like phospholipase/acyl hydrolase
LPRSYKILSIDGGGIKGLYSSTILAGIEKQNGPISEHFNMICGTSTGGIIALALAIGIPARDIANFYMTKGPLIFPPMNKLSGLLTIFKQSFIRSKYSDRELRKSLEDLFRDKTIKDIEHPIVLIPTMNLTTGENVVIKSPHQPHFTRDGKHLLVDVALATSAAPTFFPLATMKTFDGAQLIDGGMWANNPSLLGIVEALRYYVGNNKRYEQFKLLSLANISNDIGWSVKKRKSLSLRHYGTKIIEITMESQIQAINNYIQHLMEVLPGDYIRIESPNLSPEQSRCINMDRADQIALSTIAGLAESEAHKWSSRDVIKEFFKERSNA